MENTNGCSEEKFTKLEITPKPSVRVYPTPNAGRVYYTVSYDDEEGRRQRPMFPERQTAEAEAEKLAKKLEKRELPGLMVNGRERLIYERALEIAEPLDIISTVAFRSARGGIRFYANFTPEALILIIRPSTASGMLG